VALCSQYCNWFLQGVNRQCYIQRRRRRHESSWRCLSCVCPTGTHCHSHCQLQHTRCEDRRSSRPSLSPHSTTWSLSFCWQLHVYTGRNINLQQIALCLKLLLLLHFSGHFPHEAELVILVFFQAMFPSCHRLVVKVTQKALTPVDDKSSAIAEEPRDASRQLKSCQLPRNSAETICTTSPEQIEVTKLEG